MFKQLVWETPFVTNDVASAFGEYVKIEGGSVDKTLRSTANALLGMRLRHLNEKIRIRVTTGTLDEAMINALELDRYSISPSDAFLSGYLYDTEENMTDVYIQDMYCLSDKSAKFESALRFMPEGYAEPEHRMKYIESFIKQKLNTDCWVFSNPTNKLVLIYTTKWSMEFFHAIQSFMPAYLPWLFKDEKLTTSEKNLLKTLVDKNGRNGYLDALNVLYDESDLEAMKLEFQLTGFSNFGLLKLQETTKAYWENQQSRVERLLEQLAEARQKELEAKAAYMGAELMTDQDHEKKDKELIDYFSTSRAVKLESCENGYLEFYVIGHIDNWSDSEFINVMETSQNWFNSSFVMESRWHITAKEDLRRLLYAIFKERKYRIRTCAGFYGSADTPERSLAKSRFVFPANVIKDRMPNPHINEYACAGPAASRMEYYLSHQDWIGAIETCVNVAKGLTFSDSTVCRAFFRHLCATDKPIVETEDHELISPAEAVARLKGE